VRLLEALGAGAGTSVVAEEDHALTELAQPRPDAGDLVVGDRQALVVQLLDEQCQPQPRLYRLGPGEVPEPALEPLDRLACVAGVGRVAVVLPGVEFVVEELREHDEQRWLRDR